jgi:hypothetical protein
VSTRYYDASAWTGSHVEPSLRVWRNGLVLLLRDDRLRPGTVQPLYGLTWGLDMCRDAWRLAWHWNQRSYELLLLAYEG